MPPEDRNGLFGFGLATIEDGEPLLKTSRSICGRDVCELQREKPDSPIEWRTGDGSHVQW